MTPAGDSASDAVLASPLNGRRAAAFSRYFYISVYEL